MRYAEIAALLHVVEDTVFDVYVFRSYADYAWEFILATARMPAKISLFGAQNTPIYAAEMASAQTLCKAPISFKISSNLLISLYQKYVIDNITFLLETVTWLLTSTLSELR